MRTDSGKPGTGSTGPSKLITYDDLGDLALLVLNSRYLPSWCGSETIRRRLGDLDHFLRAGRRRTIEEGLRQAFEETKSAAEIRRLAREYLQRRWLGRGEVWRMLAAGSGGESPGIEGVQIEGFEHLRQALEGGRGAVLWHSPFGSPDMGARVLLGQGIPLTVVEGPGHGGAQSRVGQRFFRPRYSKGEGQLFPDRVRMSDSSVAYLSPLIRRLRRNGVIWMGNSGTSGRLFYRVDFLGLQQLFGAGVVGLAALTGAPLIPAFCFRDGDGERRLVLREPFALPQGGFTIEQLAPVVRAQAGMVEEHVMRDPLQWSRWHSPMLDSNVAHLNGVTVIDATGPPDAGIERG